MFPNLKKKKMTRKKEISPDFAFINSSNLLAQTPKTQQNSIVTLELDCIKYYKQGNYKGRDVSVPQKFRLL